MFELILVWVGLAIVVGTMLSISETSEWVCIITWGMLGGLLAYWIFELLIFKEA